MKNRISSRRGAKVFAYILAAIAVTGAIACALGAYVAWSANFYRAELSRILYDEFRQIAISECDVYVDAAARAGHEKEIEALSGYRNLEIKVLDYKGRRIAESPGYENVSESAYQYALWYRYDYNQWMNFMGDYEETQEEQLIQNMDYVVRVRINEQMPYADQYRTTWMLYTNLYGLRYVLYAAGALFVLAGIAAFAFLMCGAGHRAGKEGLTPGLLYRVPFDLLTAVCVFVWLVLFVFAGTFVSFQTPWGILLPFTAVLIIALSGIWWCTELACRVKLGAWWKNTILYRILMLVKRAVSGIVSLVRSIPLVPLVAVSMVVWFILEFFGISLFRRHSDMLFGLWFLSRIFLFGLMLNLALALRKLETGGKKLAEGQLSYKTDTRHMPAVLAHHGENLNSIAQGMQTAVNEQLKSERMKTELITNVSHDIKTPLTSIINYVDLLQKEHSAEEEQEYLAVLEKHAKRLKKLTEDLVEVSKASSGTIETKMEKGSISELLKQATGEYSERMEAQHLKCQLTMPEQEVFARFDGKLLWRVLDNLFSNVCNYAMPGTRVYVDLEEASGGDAAGQQGTGGRATCLSIKNISREPLNLTADELTERFVRGDKSRGGEGSGLGLHIAKSLTETMGGTFDVTVDGDLFKVTLQFGE